MSELAALVLNAAWRTVPAALAAALLLTLVGRRRPRTAHAIWAVLLAGMLALPLLVAAGPRWPVALPALRLPGLPLRLAAARPARDGILAAPRPRAPFPAATRAAAAGNAVAHVAPAGPASVGAAIPWSAAYGAGLLLLLVRFLYGLGMARRIRRSAAELFHPRLQELARELLPGRAVVFRSSPAVRVPFTTGVLRPQLFLPPDWAAWRDETLRGAVAHELCHIGRGDYAWAVLAELNRCLYWFHPVAWILPGRISRLADRIGDEAGAAAMRSPRVYARLLVEMAERITVRPGRLAPAPPALPIVGVHGLAARVEALLSRSAHEPRSWRRWAGAAAGAGSGLALTGVLLVAAAVEVDAGSGAPGVRPRATTAAAAGLASPDPQARADAAFALARGPRVETAIPALVRLLGDDAPIAWPHSWRRWWDGWEPARDVWDHPSPGETAAIGLASLGSRSTRPLLAVLASADPVARRNAAWGLGEIRQPRRIPEEGLAALVRALRDPDAGVRAAAAWAAGDIRIAGAVPELARLVRFDPSWRTRAEAAGALGEIRDPAARGDLEAARRRETNLAVRWAIRGALAEMPPAKGS